MATEAFRDLLYKNGTYKMTNFKVNFTHEHEEKIVLYCAQHNIDFNCANAYEATMEAFKTDPIIHKTTDNATGEETKHTVTHRIARQIECQPRAVERIADKIALTKEKFEKERIRKNIENSNIDTKPDLEKLVDNLDRLNIVDKYGYLALVCFLMQLKYTRNNKFIENDKTCVFFNGVARNGKSATAKAICDVEDNYGVVFKAQTGKLLENNHEEQVWKSHLNYFDEVKPVDIDRELLLTIVNGGNVELNPKNKKHYNYPVNTNNIFTSNDEISLRQRRVSVIKFGNRLNGRPLESGTLKKIINNIMNSLPDFERYYDIYNKVSVHNERAFNPLALESILTFLGDKFGQVTGSENSRSRTVQFSLSDVYKCIKDNYNKQIIKSERKDAIKETVEELEKTGYLNVYMYDNCSTKFYQVSGENYLKISEMNDKHNTKNERNEKISKIALYELLKPYFDTPLQEDDSDTINPEENDFSIKLPIDFAAGATKLADTTVHKRTTNNNPPLSVTADIEQKGAILYRVLIRELNQYIQNLDGTLLYQPLDNIINDIVQNCVKKAVCENIQYKYLNRLFKTVIPDFGEKHEKLLAEKYTHFLYTNMDSVLAADSMKFAGTSSDSKDWDSLREEYEICTEQRKQKQASISAENENANILNLQLSDELATANANSEKLQKELDLKNEEAKSLKETLKRAEAERKAEMAARSSAENELLELKYKMGPITEKEYLDATIPF